MNNVCYATLNADGALLRLKCGNEVKILEKNYSGKHLRVHISTIIR